MVVYFFLFRFMIRRFNYATPGREAEGVETKLYRRADYDRRRRGGDAPAAEPSPARAASSQSALILDGLGGRDNIVGLDCCATRLRVTVLDPALVDDGLLRESGAAGVIRRGDGVQVVYAPQVAVIKSELEEYIATI